MKDTPETSPYVPSKLQIVIKGFNDFTLALYKQTPKDGNTVLSPFSVASALALLELGAAGETTESLHKLLGISDSRAHREALKALIAQLKGGGPPVERHGSFVHPHSLSVQNSLWVAANYELAPSYITSALEHYAAIIDGIDVNKPEESAARVNAWVAEATNDKIKDIVSERSIDELTRLLLVNAVHFVGRWQEPFMEQATEDREFYPDGAAKAVKVPTMAQSYYFRSMQNAEIMLAEMPYWSTNDTAEIAMTIILPRKRDGLAEIEKKLSPQALNSWIAAMSQRDMVDLLLPRWKAESSAKLGEVLSAMGIYDLFSDRADFSGISSEEGLHISDVMHKTFIDVDEKGTEAAAATSILMAGAGRPPKPLEFRVDHPFLYLIRDTRTGAILFIGRVVDPR